MRRLFKLLPPVAIISIGTSTILGAGVGLFIAVDNNLRSIWPMLLICSGLGAIAGSWLYAMIDD